MSDCKPPERRTMKRITGGGEPPDNGRMDHCVAHPEQFAQESRDRLTRIDSRLDATASREDLHCELHALSWKLALLCTSLTAAVYFIARNVH